MSNDQKNPDKNTTLAGDLLIGDFLHEGEIDAQRRFRSDVFWTVSSLNAMFHKSIPLSLARAIEELPFFFIATSNTKGDCDCSFRGVEHDDVGQPYPLVRILNGKTLIFPDYQGNRLYNSLGNIIVNGHIGMLFIDFQTQSRVRINGLAEIIEDQSAYSAIWPLAHRYVKVTVEQFYGNCKARIPRMEPVSINDGENDSE